jgi:hypothetical protein
MNKKLYLFLSFTWGLPVTILGSIIALGLIIVGVKPEKFCYGYCFRFGKTWGTFDLGPFFFTDKRPEIECDAHEFGHSIQNIMFGPLALFVVFIPSMLRYSYREVYTAVDPNEGADLPDYEAIWFESQATRLGTKLTKKYYNVKELKDIQLSL